MSISSYTANPPPMRAGPGVPPPCREIHDEPLENLGKTMVSVGCGGIIRGAATSPLAAPRSRSRFTEKPYKTNGKTAFPARLQKPFRQSSIETNPSSELLLCDPSYPPPLSEFTIYRKTL